MALANEPMIFSSSEHSFGKNFQLRFMYSDKTRIVIESTAEPVDKRNFSQGIDPNTLTRGELLWIHWLIGIAMEREFSGQDEFLEQGEFSEQGEKIVDWPNFWAQLQKSKLIKLSLPHSGKVEVKFHAYCKTRTNITQQGFALMLSNTTYLKAV